MIVGFYEETQLAASTTTITSRIAPGKREIWREVIVGFYEETQLAASTTIITSRIALGKREIWREVIVAGALGSPSVPDEGFHGGAEARGSSRPRLVHVGPVHERQPGVHAEPPEGLRLPVP